MSEAENAYKTSTYYVNPTFTVKDGNVTDADYEYYNENGMKIVNPTAENMRADKQGGTGDFVGFTMRGFHFKDASGEKPSDGHVYTAKLYCAVAQTLFKPEQIPNFILSGDSKGLIIPIYKGTARGVILIFQIFQDERFVQLVGSPDPEIGNSTNGD
ncbi:hypothetical protein [Massilia sp. YIM B04103]|uniref:hypothetical protein n=1 Tax=Massilia sp. YIM B04103 TaxID=2963106 RepID=UPI00210E8081|nr:hypothetical protein [Massilia sp. YIM B04103]